MLITEEVDRKIIKAIFSGDTIVDEACWGSFELMKLWLKLFFPMASKDREVIYYWFLICMAPRTYRFLPVFFKEFYPCYFKDTPEFEKKLLNKLASRKYPTHYLPSKGIITFGGRREKLSSFLINKNKKLKDDEHVKFFFARNPGYSEGDELACLAKISFDNFTPSTKRILRDIL